MGVLFTFAGQGAQRPGMLSELPDSSAVRDTLASAHSVLDRPYYEMDTEEALLETEDTQLALTIAGVAGARHLIADQAPPDAVMGLSVGAFAAAVIAGVLDFADALRLVRIRARLMADAYPHGYGMSAIIGLDETRVRDLVAAGHHDDEPLYLANVNSDQQMVVAGSDAALDWVDGAAREAGANRVQRLNMAVPSHCALLDAPAAAFAEQAANVPLHEPAGAYFSANAKRRLWDARAIRDDLVFNMARSVYWAASARVAHESGFTLAVEMPPAAVLTKLHPAMDTPGEAVAVADAGWHNAAALIRRAHDDPR